VTWARDACRLILSMRKMLVLAAALGGPLALAQTPTPKPFVPVTIRTGELKAVGGSLAKVPTPKPFVPMTIKTGELKAVGMPTALVPTPKPFKPMTIKVPELRAVGAPQK